MYNVVYVPLNNAEKRVGARNGSHHWLWILPFTTQESGGGDKQNKNVKVKRFKVKFVTSFKEYLLPSQFAQHCCQRRLQGHSVLLLSYQSPSYIITSVPSKCLDRYDSERGFSHPPTSNGPVRPQKHVLDLF